MITLLLALAGGVGAVARLAVDGTIRLRRSTALPWATVLINVSGSFVLGLLTGLVLHHVGPSGAGTDLKLVLGTGFCGGYTTFSTASIETVRLAQQRQVALALVNGVGTAGLTLGSAAIGFVLTR
jgi:fluoride exporter